MTNKRQSISVSAEQPDPNSLRVDVRDLNKTFVLHNQNQARIPVLEKISLQVSEGECLVLSGPSGTGKSTLLRTLYGNYRAGSGSVRIRGHHGWTDLVNAEHREITHLRRHSLGYVSQFLRVIPRVSTLDVTMQPLLEQGECNHVAKDKACSLLTLLNVPEHLWALPPATFSGGEQQRVNIARGFMLDYPVMLLDEPTASLDSKNRDVVVGLIDQAKAKGAAIVGIFHDESVRDRVADRAFTFESDRMSDKPSNDWIQN